MGFVVKTFFFKFSIIILGILVLKLGSHAKVLPLEEVRILETIFDKLRNSNLTFTQDSCGKPEWNRTEINGNNNTESVVMCNCSYANDNACHVTNIRVKGFNMTGVLPTELGNLTHLVELDLTRNYINGTIPTILARLPNLQILSLSANRLNGSIPNEIGNIATLQQLVLEENELGGPLPQSLGNLTSLYRLLLSANNFTGVIPDTFGNLKNLSDFRLDGNQMSGKIPAFIGNWTNITKLYLQGTSLQGPIPSSISLLTNLEQLFISDLYGSSSDFPNLRQMEKMKRLVLRNCLITGRIPDYIGKMKDLKLLDLSFNGLTGPIPVTFKSLDHIDYMFLTNNSLTEALPNWIVSSKRKLDLSYNNFTGSVTLSCQHPPPEVNLVSAFSSSDSNKNSWCFENDLTCSGRTQHSSLFINCGGDSKTYGGNTYDEDLSPEGPSTFSTVAEKWAYSSTGLFFGYDDANFLATNRFNLTVKDPEPELYTSARLAPQSLKYYGLCMLKGSYKVKLHFAEIMYSNDQTYSSLGRRIFDVSVQGIVRKDFNIMEKAGGPGRGIVEKFDNVWVNGTTLEIHLYWAGKGTNAVPDKGIYGPLISAITVTPNFKVDDGKGFSAGAIVGIVAASLVLIALILIVLQQKGYLGKREPEDKELRGLDLQTGYFTLRQIKHATNNFDVANKIGEGGFGPVYKGILSDGAVIAVKQLSAKSKQGNREFVNEIGMISALQHPNLVRLYGCCIEGNQLLLVYEYLENNSLARALFGHEENRLHLDWPTRKKIMLGIAKGLAYLHEESMLKIVHRDIKATNVLLDKDLTAKISDFGLARLDDEENTHISTRIAGTLGYMAPEYAMRGYLTDKADVYSFGIVALEIVSGKSNANYRQKKELIYLLDMAYVLQEQGNLLELVDPSLGSEYSKEEVKTVLNLALLCTNPSPTLRPTMSSVVSMVEGKIPVQAAIIGRGSVDQDARVKAFGILSQDSQTQISKFSQDSEVQGSVSMDGTWIDSSSNDVSQDHASSMLLKDLYNVNLE